MAWILRSESELGRIIPKVSRSPVDILSQILYDKTIDVGKKYELLIQYNILYCLVARRFIKLKQWQGCLSAYT